MGVCNFDTSLAAATYYPRYMCYLKIRTVRELSAVIQDQLHILFIGMGTGRTTWLLSGVIVTEGAQHSTGSLGCAIRRVAGSNRYPNIWHLRPGGYWYRPCRDGRGGCLPVYAIVSLGCQGRISIEFDIEKLLLTESDIAGSQRIDLTTPKVG